MEMHIEDPAEVILLVKEKTGRMHAWKVEPAQRADFRIVNQNGRLPIATISATGTFRRQSRAANDPILDHEQSLKELNP